jgi:hypothetical protein
MSDMSDRSQSPWRGHPKLQGKFHPEYPDDIQVVVHDGSARFSPHPPELVWVRMTGMNGDVFQGKVLNQPHNLQSVQQGSILLFVAGGGQYPVLVTEKYLAERGNWIIEPCSVCGFSEMFDAPSDFQRAAFPNAPQGAGVMAMSTVRCPMNCNGMLMLRARGLEPEAPAPRRRAWWRRS